MIKIIINIISIFCLTLFVTFTIQASELNQKKVETIIENFLIKNPQLLKSILDNHVKNTELEKKKNVIQSLKLIKNPGFFQKFADITIYEFFDYNCGYCKSVAKTIMEIISEDKKINLSFIEFPILSQASYFAAAAALASQKQGLYKEFHFALMNVRGKIDENQVMQTANKIGLNIDQLKKDMSDEDINKILKKNREIAKLLNLNGTPAFIIKDNIYPGALTKENFKKIIQKIREG